MIKCDNTSTLQILITRHRISFFLKNGLFCDQVFESFNTLYNVSIQNNDVRAMIARVSFIQKNEVDYLSLSLSLKKVRN